jgi:transcriptional regulator with GAF, ATPase, and Fis domain
VVSEEGLDSLEAACAAQDVGVVALPLVWTGLVPAVDPRLLDFIRAHARHLDVVIYADTHRIPLGIYCQTLAAGARRVLDLRSPNFPAELAETLARLQQDRQARQGEHLELVRLFAEFGLIGCSVSLLTVFHRALKASHFSDLPVLILGETGTGKQQLAEAIHQLDPRRADKPFVCVNCGAISKSLAESELFGHTRGAFSGASGDRTGLFRSANGGTLLLDEIGELGLDLQPKLLRVLQERRLLPVGEDYEHAIDIRVIAATNQPLREMVVEGRFREDLYQRLNVFRIAVPPLRARPEDIEVQARHFLRLWGEDHRVAVDFGPRFLEALCSLPWEGNSRQLKHFLWETLAHKGSGAQLQIEDLPQWVLERLATVQAQPTEVVSPEELAKEMCSRRVPLNQALEEYERRLIRAVLEENDGNRTRAAAQLGLTPRSVFNKIKKYQLE